MRCINIICATPASNTAKHSGHTKWKIPISTPNCDVTCPKIGVVKMPPIRQIFKITGAAAPPKNRLCAFVTAAHKATSDIIGRYGIVIRAKATVESNKVSSSTKPGARNAITDGMNISASTTIILSARSNIICTSAANIKADGLPCVVRTWAKTGKNAFVIAPSAVRRLNKFGNLKATKNASAAAPAPINCARQISRKNPSTRDKAVRPPICLKLRSKSSSLRNFEIDSTYPMPHHYLALTLIFLVFSALSSHSGSVSRKYL